MSEHNMAEDVSSRRMEDVREGEATQRRILRPSVERVIDSLASYEDNIILGEEGRPRVAPQETSESSSSSSSSSSETYDSPRLRNRAFRILERGSMSKCPPARRDRSRVSEIKFYNGDQEMCWPLVNWRTLTADQRLLAREYAAMFLDNKGKIQALTSTRRQLLNKYMFLMLNGEGRPQNEEDENAKVEGKIKSDSTIWST
ncbi:hypothetical protein DPMN_110466 [Dreissena polymorpha]|uniref:Uncharacterized protein n=1 Tax=Dreissena polymorpha TaxID=45954 RepID=A0A9D4QN28_DREPO|nr:hypothetical protein DPMN_110466 [Dreissena polymorpha]